MGKWNKNSFEKFILSWTINIIGLFLAAFLVSGISYPPKQWWVIVIAALVFGLINILIKPVILFLAIPTLLITFGLFYFVINALMLWLVTIFVPGFEIASFWSALGGALVISGVNFLINSFLMPEGPKSIDIHFLDKRRK